MLLKRNIKVGKNRNNYFLLILFLLFYLNFLSNSESSVNLEGSFTSIKVLDKNNVFVFNGWMFSSSPSIKPFDHPVYDIWLVGCKN